MEIKNFKPSDRAPVLCSFDLFFPKMGMTIRELRLMETNGQKWVSFPAKQYESEGKKKFYSYVMIEKERKDAFDVKIMELLEPLLGPFPVQSDMGDCPF